MTGSAQSAESANLLSGAAFLRELLEPYGFAFSLEASATSSGGPFAAGTFRKGDVQIGLIVRNGSQLGCPNYSVGTGYAGHSDLIAALGAAGQEDLVAAEWLAYESRTGRPPFESLKSDLEMFILPVLAESSPRFQDALTRAVSAFRARLGLR